MKCCHVLRCLVIVLFGLGATVLAASQGIAAPLDEARIGQLAKMLPEEPKGVGRPITDREAWQQVARSPRFKGVVGEAEGLLDREIPELPDDLFLDFSRTGNRSRYQRVLGRRHGRLPDLVLAECIENQGRFLPAIEEAIRAICDEKTWVLPAHDRSLANFKGTTIEIDLVAAATGWNLATTDYWLGDKLSDETRKLIRSELKRRIFDPMRGYVTEGKPALWWATGTNNWNAVCLAGVTGTALAIVESPEDRAFFVAAAEKYIQNFLNGFTADGYCSEGIGYYNYGFGHFVLLAETIYQAAGGKVDLFEDPRIKQIALFGRRMEILPGIYPPFADCTVGSQPDERMVAFLSRRFKLGLKDVEREGLLLASGPTSSLFYLGVFGFPNSASQTPPVEGTPPGQPLRDWFADAGVLVCRPLPGSANALGVAMKGGHNAEHHNHNDVGSYLVALHGGTPLLDPGAEVYTARTFSSRRYDSGLLNSFGHPVPRVAGKLQSTGRRAEAKVLKTEFTEKQDTLALDLRAAYPVEELKKLTRTFVFSREGQGSLTVVDEVAFSSPQPFETALITATRWRKVGEDRLVVGTGNEAVEVQIATDGPPFHLTDEVIHEDTRGIPQPTRIGIVLDEPVATATITVTIAPP